MKVTSTGIVDGILDVRFGRLAKTDLYKKLVCKRNPQLKITGAPAGTKSYAVYMEDRQAAPVWGFSWIHWLAANITSDEVPENSTRTADYVQGLNSKISPIIPEEIRFTKEEAIGYQGPGPRNEPHKYTFRIYALDTMLDLKDGFWLHELFDAMEGHILDECALNGVYMHE